MSSFMQLIKIEVSHSGFVCWKNYFPQPEKVKVQDMT